MLENYKIFVKASPTILTVGSGPEDFRTIQEAINNASSGDTIFVRNGTYYENIVINKTITLIGENRDFTIVNGDKTDHVITIEADNVSIQGFTIMKSGPLQYGGIFLKPPSAGNIITNNKIIENFYGIFLRFSDNNFISGNLIFNNSYGIGFISCSNNLIFSNTIFSNINDGIYLLTSFNNFISYNVIFSNNLAGISLYNCEGNIVYRNTISTNLFLGIFLSSSFDNMISANTIVNNPSGGMITIFSSNNTICRNNLNNPVQVYSSDSTNFWSFNGEGNYWSNYNGTDFYKGPHQDYPGSDGIGDVPYIIDKNNVDSSPLMGMFHAFDITHKGETYYTSIVSNSTVSDFQFQVGMETGNRIMHFRLSGNESTFGFCRVMVPTVFMNYPYIVLLDNEEVDPIFLDVSNETHVYLYFTYSHRNQTVTIISSEWYSELIDIYHDLNATYYNLLNVYGDLLYNYTQLQESFRLLNASYQYLYDLNVTFYNFLNDYARLQEDFYHLNETYHNLVNFYGKLQENFDNLSLSYQSIFDAFVLLLGNFTQLREDYQVLNASYQDHLRSYSENVSVIQNLTYVIAATTAILIIVTTYLSKRAYSGGTPKFKRFEEE
jgi:parallel beta-helix repeat protein